MRLVSVATSAALSAVLLSGCSFITGKPGKYENPYAKQKAAHHGQYGAHHAANRCQVYSPRAPIPQGCRPEQVTLATAPQGQYGHPSGFAQQPQFGQPQYASGSYGTAVGQAHGTSNPHYNTGPKLKKPRLRGSLSLGVEKSVSGELIDYSVRDAPDINPLGFYDPQVFNQGQIRPGDNGGTVTEIFTANEQSAVNIFNPFTYESDTRPSISFDDAWSTPATLKGGVEYIVGKNTTVFANGGYTHAEGNEGSGATVSATIYRDFSEVDDAGNLIASGVEFTPNVEIANFSYNFSDLKKYDLEVGGRHYLKPLVQSEGFRTITPFVGGSVGASHVNAVDVTFSQQQASYSTTFENVTTGSNDGVTDFFDVPADNPGANPLLGTTTRLYDSQWLPQGQLNVGAEWQVTPGFALAAETGVRIQGAREYADFTNAAGDTVSGEKGDANISIPFTLRGSVNF